MGSFDWLFLHVQSTCGLPDPRASWDAWLDVMVRTPGKFKGWIKRSLALELIVDSCASAHAKFFKLCRSHASDPGMRHDVPDQEPVVDWASHAARAHSYRTQAAKLLKAQCVRVVARPMPTLGGSSAALRTRSPADYTGLGLCPGMQSRDHILSCHLSSRIKLDCDMPVCHRPDDCAILLEELQGLDQWGRCS